MKVNIDVQFLCTENLRGIPYYICNIAESLLHRNRNEYTLSFFDLNHERGNRRYVEKYLSKEVQQRAYINECSKLSFSTIIDSNIMGKATAYDYASYREWMNLDADIHHFTQSVNIPFNIDKRSIVTVHDLLPVLPGTTLYYKDYIVKAFENCMKYIRENKWIDIIVDSMSTKKDVMQYYNFSEDRVHVVPLAYDPRICYVDKNLQMLQQMGIDGPFLLYLGAIDSRKGIFDILKAFELIKQKNSEIKLVLAGGMNAAEESLIYQKIGLYNACEDILFTGFVDDKTKRVLLSSAEVFLFPSEYEGFGIPILEAMACGTPVITTNVSSLPEVGGNAAMYVTPKKPEQLAAAIERMLYSENLRQEYVAKGFENIKNFSWDKTAELTENIYETVYNR